MLSESLKTSGMPEAQADSIRGVLLSMSQRIYSFAWLSGFMGIVVGMNAMLIAVSMRNKNKED